MVNRWLEPQTYQVPETATMNLLAGRAGLPLGPASLPAAAAIEFLRLMRVTFDAVADSSKDVTFSPPRPCEGFFHQLCRSASIAIIATDPKFRIQFWNPLAQEFFGGTPAQRFGQSLLDVVPQPCRESALRTLERALNTGDPNELEFQYETPDGRKLSLAATISPIRDEHGKACGVSCYVRNVSRRVQLQREMIDTQKMSALGAMAGAVAHHFNNVLGGVITSIDFAQSSDNPATLRRVLKTTVDALTRANQLTLGLLAFAEGESTDPAAAEIYTIVQDFLTELAPRLTARRIALDADLQPLPIKMPAKRVRTLLDRLTANACEAMPQGGRLRVELRRDGEDVVLVVADTGVGLPPEAAAHLFEPFFTTKGSPNSQSEHIGLGLAVVHGIVRQLGGTASLGSQPTGGTVCTIRLPISHPAQR